MRLIVLTFWRIFSTVCAFAVLAGLLVMVNLESILMVNVPLLIAEHAIVLDGNNARLLRAK